MEMGNVSKTSRQDKQKTANAWYDNSNSNFICFHIWQSDFYNHFGL